MEDGKGPRKSTKGGVSLLNPHARQLAQPPRNGRKLREGWLLIAGYSRLRGVFVDKRYFVLWENQTLSFFAAPPYNDRSAPIGALALSEHTAVRPVKVKGQEWSFEIKLSPKAERVMRVGAMDEAERDRWMSAIINCSSGETRNRAARKPAASGEISDTDSDNEDSVSRFNDDPEFSVSSQMGAHDRGSPVIDGMKVRDIDNDTWMDLDLDDVLTKEDRRNYVEVKQSKIATIRSKDKRSSDEYVGSGSPRIGSLSRGASGSNLLSGGGVFSAISRNNRNNNDAERNSPRGSIKSNNHGDNSILSPREKRGSNDKSQDNNVLPLPPKRGSNDKSNSPSGSLSPRGTKDKDDQDVSTHDANNKNKTIPDVEKDANTPTVSRVLTWEGVLGRAPPAPPSRLAANANNSNHGHPSSMANTTMSSNDSNSSEPILTQNNLYNTSTTTATTTATTTTSTATNIALQRGHLLAMLVAPTNPTPEGGDGSPNHGLRHVPNQPTTPGLMRENSWGALPPRSPLPKPLGIVRPTSGITWEGVLGTPRSPPPPPTRAPPSSPPSIPRPPFSPSFVTLKLAGSSTQNDTPPKPPQSTTMNAPAVDTSTPVSSTPPPSPAIAPAPPQFSTSGTETSTTTATQENVVSPKRKPIKPPHGAHNATMPSPAKIAQMSAALFSESTTSSVSATIQDSSAIEPDKEPHQVGRTKPMKPISNHKNATLGAVRRAASPSPPLSDLTEMGVYFSPKEPPAADGSDPPLHVRERSVGMSGDSGASVRSASAHARLADPTTGMVKSPSGSGMNHAFSAVSISDSVSANPRRSPSPPSTSARGRTYKRRSSSASPPRGSIIARAFRHPSSPSHGRTQSEHTTHVPSSLLQTSVSFLGTQPAKSKKTFPKFATLWGGLRPSHTPKAEDSVLEERDGVNLRDMLREQHAADDDDDSSNSSTTFRNALRSKPSTSERGSFRSERGSFKFERESVDGGESIYRSMSQDRDGNSLREQLQRSRAGLPPADGEEDSDTAPWSRDDVLRERSMTVRGVYQLGQWIWRKEDVPAYFWDDGFDGYENTAERVARRPKRRSKPKRVGKDGFEEGVAPTLSQGALDKINQARLRRKQGAEPTKTCLHAGWVLKAGVGPLMGKTYKRRFLMLWSTNELTWTRVQPYNNKSSLRGKLESIFLESEVGATSSPVGFTWELRLQDIRTYKFVAQTHADREAWVDAIALRGVNRFDRPPAPPPDHMRRQLRSSVSCASPPVVSYVHFDEHSFEDGDILPSFTRERRNQLETPIAYLLSEVDRAPNEDDASLDDKPRSRLHPRFLKSSRPSPLSTSPAVASSPLSHSSSMSPSSKPYSPTHASPSSPTFTSSPSSSSFGSPNVTSPSLRPLSPPLKSYFPASPPLKAVSSPPLKAVSSPPLKSVSSPVQRSSPPKSPPLPPVPPLALPDAFTSVAPPLPAVSKSSPSLPSSSADLPVESLSPRPPRQRPVKPPRKKHLLAAATTDAQRLEAAIWVAEGAAAAATSASSIAATYEATAMHALFSISFVIFQHRD